MSAGMLAGIISFSGFYFYIRDIVNKKAKPNQVTWWVWTFVGGVLFESYYAANGFAHYAIWVPLSYFIGPLIIAILSLHYGEGGKTKIDLYIFVLSTISIILWIIVGQPWLALMMNIIADFLGAIPMIFKVYKYPNTESRCAWGFFLVGNAFNLLALQSWTLVEFLYPLYLFIMSLFIFWLTMQQLYNQR